MSDESEQATPAPEDAPRRRRRRRRRGPARERWRSTNGFVLATVGAAVGLGNLWRFSYLTAEHGGAAFVAVYIVMLFLIGTPLLMAELALGRSTRRGPIGSLRATGLRGAALTGGLFVLASLMILAYFSVIAGWILRYAIDALHAPLWGHGEAYFTRVATGGGAVLYHVAVMALATAIVAAGVKNGIERASRIMTLALAIIVLGGVIYAVGLPGAGAGYRFYLVPGFGDLLSLGTLSAAASHAFYSLALGMGVMLTYGSYRSGRANLASDAATIAFADLTLALLAGLAIFPIVFTVGMQGSVGGTTVGALFTALPAGFVSMGPTGRIVGGLFFLALLFAAITTAVALLEVVAASARDELRVNRRVAAWSTGVLATLLGILPAYDLGTLAAMDAAASEVFLPLGGLVIAVRVGWLKPGAATLVGASPSRNARLVSSWQWVLRLAVPPLLILVLWQNIAELLGRS